ncbi:hypothetical protein ACWCPM_24120 [Streptomyces sp. NPDC002309]
MLIDLLDGLEPWPLLEREHVRLGQPFGFSLSLSVSPLTGPVRGHLE